MSTRGNKRHYAQLLELTSTVLASADPEEAWSMVGEDLLNHHFEADLFTVNEFSTAGYSSVPQAYPDWVISKVPPLPDLFQLFASHPLIEHLSTAPLPFAPRRSSDAVSLSAWLSCPTRSILNATLGITHQLAIPLPPNGRTMRTIVLMRAGHDFTGNDLAQARRLQVLLVGFDRHLTMTAQDLWYPSGSTPQARGLPKVTPRELAVLRLLGSGLTAQAIARRLAISPRTVHKHLEHIYTKFEEFDRLKVVLQARDMGIL